jgi:hypothetical protein
MFDNLSWTPFLGPLPPALPLAELLQKILLGQERAEKKAEEQAAAQKEHAMRCGCSG